MQTLQTIFAFVLSFALLLPACREDFVLQPWERDDEIEEEEPVDSPSPPSPSRFSRTPSPPIAESTESSEEEPETTEYATGLYVIAGCEANPEEHLIADYESMPVCRNITIIPWQNNDGDTYEVAAPFNWSVDDPVGFSLEFPLGETNNLIRPIAVGNPLTENGEERTTVLHACATNDCPMPTPEDCAETLCVDLPLVAVARLGGTWVFTSSQHDGISIQLSQDGRTFKSNFGTTIQVGFVQNSFVTFESGDYQFDGMLSNDAHSMSGTITELMGMNPAGSWFAVRVD